MGPVEAVSGQYVKVKGQIYQAQVLCPLRLPQGRILLTGFERWPQVLGSGECMNVQQR